MAHVLLEKKNTKPIPAEWLGISAATGELVREWSGRYDVIAQVGPEVGEAEGLIACFTPNTLEVDVNSTLAFGKVTPTQIGDIREKSVQYEFPRAIGAITHEAFHARFSTWSLPNAHAALSAAEYRALNLLEESRIEALGVLHMPKSRVFLRASAMDLVVGDLNSESNIPNTQFAAQTIALVRGRVIAGVLDEDEVSGILIKAESMFHAETITALSDVLSRFQKTPAHELHTMYELAREWVRLVSEASEENGEEQGKSGDKSSDSGDGEGSGSGSSFIDDLLDQLSDICEDISIAVSDEVADQEESEAWAEDVKDRGNAAKIRKENLKRAADVFGKGTGPDDSKRTSSRLISTRKASSGERSAAVVVGTMLDKAKYRDRDATEISSVLPPGRLRTRSAVQAAAARSRGVLAPQEMWRRTVHKQTDDPTLSVGVMVDISGSMGSAMEPMASAAWIMSEAVRRVQGRAAMVYYGADVFATLKPGQHLTDVSVYNAPDGTEVFDKAFRALDGGLDLLNGRGARLLVVVSDGCYTHEEVENGKRWVDACKAAGVGILWLSFDGDAYYLNKILRGYGHVVTGASLDPASASKEIGKAAASALEQAGAGR
jgi:hypothetical protein